MAEKEILFSAEDERFMRMAIDLAKQAALEDEVPIGAVLVHKGEVISRAYNRHVRRRDRERAHPARCFRRSRPALRRVRLALRSFCSSDES